MTCKILDSTGRNEDQKCAFGDFLLILFSRLFAYYSFSFEFLNLCGNNVGR